MLELMGSGYVIEHVAAEHNSRMKEEMYRVYVTDVLKHIAESWGTALNFRYAEMIEEPKETEESGDEVALKVISKLGLKVKTDGFYETESDPVAGFK